MKLYTIIINYIIFLCLSNAYYIENDNINQINVTYLYHM